MTDYIINIIPLLIIVISALVGYKRGLVKLILPAISLILTFLLTGIISKPASDYVYNNLKITNQIRSGITEKVPLNPENTTDYNIQNTEIDNLNIPDVIKEKLKEKNSLTEYTKVKVSSFNEYVIEYLTKLVVRICTYIICFIALYIIIRLIIKLLDIACALPVVGSINKITGMIFGVIFGIVIVWIVNLLMNILQINTGIAIDNNYLNQFINKSNIFLNNLIS